MTTIMNPYLYIPAIVSILIGLYIYRDDRKGRNSKGEVVIEGLGKFKGVTWFLFLIIGIVLMAYASV
jgi:hypothetical protein